jgi:hypothetical protein
MHDHGQIILAIAGKIGDHGLARFGNSPLTPAKRALPETCHGHPARACVGIEDHQIKIVLGRFHEHEVFATIIVQVAGNHIAFR